MHVGFSKVISGRIWQAMGHQFDMPGLDDKILWLFIVYSCKQIVSCYFFQICLGGLYTGRVGAT